MNVRDCGVSVSRVWRRAAVERLPRSVVVVGSYAVCWPVPISVLGGEQNVLACNEGGVALKARVYH
eukprot:5186115-Prymnesium_polylepis.1